MNIKIKNRFTGKILFEHREENNSIRITLEAGIKAGVKLTDANLPDANLAYANLAGANLTDANLAGANLARTNLTGANLAYANLAYANLAGANLTDANLAGAKLDGTNLTGANLAGSTYGKGIEIGNNPIFIIGLTWPVYIFKNHIKIGCQIHSKAEWLAMSDEDIEEMGSCSTEFWKKWKKHILWMAFEGENN